MFAPASKRGDGVERYEVKPLAAATGNVIPVLQVPSDRENGHIGKLQSGYRS